MGKHQKYIHTLSDSTGGVQEKALCGHVLRTTAVGSLGCYYYTPSVAGGSAWRTVSCPKCRELMGKPIHDYVPVPDARALVASRYPEHYFRCIDTRKKAHPVLWVLGIAEDANFAYGTSKDRAYVYAARRIKLTDTQGGNDDTATTNT